MRTEREMQSALESRDAGLCDAYLDAATPIDDAFDHAQSLAHDPDALAELQADAKLDYSRLFLKLAGKQLDLFEAAEYLRLRVMAGRYDEADCIARDMTNALAAEIGALIRAGRV